MAHNGSVRPLLLPVLACALGLAVAACGGSGGDGKAAPDPATAASAASTATGATAAAPDLRGVAIAVRRDPG